MKDKKMASRDDYLIILLRYFFLIFFLKAYVVSTHLNYVNLLRQFK